MIFFNQQGKTPQSGFALPPRSFLRSPLILRLLTVNLIAPVLLLAGLYYTDHYQRGLVTGTFNTLKVQAELVALAISEGAVAAEGIPGGPPPIQERTLKNGFFGGNENKGAFLTETGRRPSSSSVGSTAFFLLRKEAARRILMQLSQIDSDVRVRLFDHNGVLSSDSRQAGQATPKSTVSLEKSFFGAQAFPHSKLMPYEEPKNMTAFDYEEVGSALGDGKFASEIRYSKVYGTILSVAVPVISNNQIVGVVMVTGGVEKILKNLALFRFSFFRLFLIALGITILLSVFMVGTIVRPLNRLSRAALNVRTAGGRRQRIPDETKRKDEIGALSGALINMTDTIWERLDATEKFAADVSHELKNPLSSMRSALETADMIANPDKKKRLMGIVRDDVLRMDRLITDISNLSRLDAELSREIFENINIYKLSSSVVEVCNMGESAQKRGLKFVLNWDPALTDRACVLGMESRLAQVFHNLIGNAVSFSPDNGTVSVSARKDGGDIVLFFDDEGKGISPGDEKKLFDRFYCERPAQEKFGHHSGLGLSISQKIVTGLSGRIYAENRIDENGKILGARFVVVLPLIRGEE